MVSVRFSFGPPRSTDVIPNLVEQLSVARVERIPAAARLEAYDAN
jgi:hypothetical protein